MTEGEPSQRMAVSESSARQPKKCQYGAAKWQRNSGKLTPGQLSSVRPGSCPPCLAALRRWRFVGTMNVRECFLVAKNLVIGRARNISEAGLSDQTTLIALLAWVGRRIYLWRNK